MSPPVSDRSCSWFCLRLSGRRRPSPLVAPQRTACQHDQTVETERYARGLRHRGNGIEKLLVERVALAVAPRLLVHGRRKAAALFGRIGQFAEAIRQFDSAGIDLETFGHARIRALCPRQR